MQEIDLITALLSYEAAKDERIESCAPGTPGEQLSVIKDGILLSPRDTKRWVVSTYERQLGRKLSKKEANLAMAHVRKYITKLESEEAEVIVSNRPAIVSNVLTWADDTPFSSEVSL